MGAIFIARYGTLRLFELVFPRQVTYRGLYLTLIPRGLAAAVLSAIPVARGIEGAGVFLNFGFALIFLALTGCRIVIKGPENGVVTTASGAYGCNPDIFAICYLRS